MSSGYAAQVKKLYVLGVHNDSNVSVQMHTLDLNYISPFYSLKSVAGECYH